MAGAGPTTPTVWKILACALNMPLELGLSNSCCLYTVIAGADPTTPAVWTLLTGASEMPL